LDITSDQRVRRNLAEITSQAGHIDSGKDFACDLPIARLSIVEDCGHAPQVQLSEATFALVRESCRENTGVCELLAQICDFTTGWLMSSGQPACKGALKDLDERLPPCPAPPNQSDHW
jgi:hypothetical protein